MQLQSLDGFKGRQDKDMRSFGNCEQTKHIGLRLPEIGKAWKSAWGNLYMLALFSFIPGHLFLPQMSVDIGLG